MFGSIKTNTGVIALLVRFIWVSVNAAIRTLVRTKQADLFYSILFMVGPIDDAIVDGWQISRCWAGIVITPLPPNFCPKNVLLLSLAIISMGNYTVYKLQASGNHY